MELTEELDLARQYLHEKIDMSKHISFSLQMSIYKRSGYWETGKNRNEFPSFEIWKKLRIYYSK